MPCRGRSRPLTSSRPAGRLVGGFEALDESDLASKTVDVGFLPAPVDIRFLATMRLSEVGLHRWDIDVTSDPGAAAADYVVPVMLVSLPMFAGFFAKPIGLVGQVAIYTVAPERHYVSELTETGGSRDRELLDGRGPVWWRPFGCRPSSGAQLRPGSLQPARTKWQV